MIRVLGFWAAAMFATTATAQGCVFFCEDQDDNFHRNFFTKENVQKLLIEGADIDERDESGNTVLALAVHTGNLEMFQMLLEAGADSRTRNDGETTLLHTAMTARMAGIHSAPAEEYLEIIRHLIDAGLDVNDSSNPLSFTPIWIAVYAGTPSGAGALIAAGADIEHRVRDRATPLHYASKPVGMPGLLEALVLGGANVDAKDDVGATPLHYAAGSRSTTDIATLITHGANVNARNDQGQTPLMYTTDSDSDEGNLIYLLSVGADPNLQDGSGLTALHYTVNSAPALIVRLLEAGADATIRSNDGQTAFDLIRDNPEMIGTDSYVALEAVSE